jgi:hypothetical protein
MAGPVSTFAAPAPAGPQAISVVSQNVDYIGAESGAALDLGFPVLVPGWVPSPFGGSPSIDAGGGYYSLYWMNAGGDPTFLQVTGQVGGGLPAGSPYDLNVELSINASVQGYGAIHDVTPAYDAVWWIAGGVLYKVESRNSGTDSLTIANSLIAFQPPSAPEPEPEPTSPPLEPTAEPPVSEPETDTGGSETIPETSEESAGEDTSTSGDEPEEQVDQVSPGDGTGESAEEGDDAAETPEPTSIASDGTGQPSVTSDGTGGAQIPVIGGDGTGGTNDIVIPRRSGVQVP